MSRMITELGYLGFEVSNMSRWEQFASNVLGMRVLPGPRPDMRRLRMDDNSYRILLTEGPADDCVLAGWQVSDSDTVEAFGRHLDQHGVAWTWATDEELSIRIVKRMLHFKDPAGNRHEVYCGPQIATERFASAKVAAGFITRGEGLGHVVYASPTYKESLEFAKRVLQFGPSDDIIAGPDFVVAFYHVNARHHSYAVAPQTPSPHKPKSIHHFMIEVKSVEEVGFARDRCLDMEQPVHMDIGQHPNDRMISFYGETPSGFWVEFGYGGVKVNDATWQTATYDRLSEWGHRPNREVTLRPPGTAPRVVAGSESDTVRSTWDVVMKTPVGDDKVVMEMQIVGDGLTGSIISGVEAIAMRDGKADGNSLSWRSKVTRPMAMDLQFTAKIAGDNISGAAKSPFGEAPFTGTRKQ